MITPEVAAQRRERLVDLVPSPVGPFASNNWAVDGSHTANGRPLVAGDPHQPLRSPSLFWMQHMNSADAGGRFDVTGFAFAGTPGVQLGHNRHIAWTATTNYPDISDIWEVRASRSSVYVGGLEVAIEAHEETIEVAGGESVSVTIEEVPGYGVLLPDDLLPIPIAGAGRRMLYRWVGMRATQEAYSFLALDLAEDLEDFEAAVDGMEIGCFNFVGATADGIAYRSSPLVPDRGPGATERMHWTMLDGDDASTLWEDGAFLGPDQLPHSRGGDRGWIATANNDPFGFTADGTTSGDPFYFGVFFDPGTRAARIERRLEELAAAGAITPEDMQALQMDSHSVFADRLMPALEEAWAAVETDEALVEYRDRPELETLMGVLSEWDHELVRDSSGAVPFDIFLFFAAKLALEDDFAVIFDTILGDEPTYAMKWAVLTLLDAYDRADELLDDGRDVILLRALDAAAGLLVDRFGGVTPERYRWGDHHGSYIGSDWGERLDAGWISTDGGIGTINVSSASLLRGGEVVDRLESTSGPLYRMVAAFGDDGVPQATVTVSRGSSGDPDSPFFANTTEDWVEGNYRPMLFTRAEAQADSVEQRTLSPLPLPLP
jgi:penicillin amidase